MNITDRTAKIGLAVIKNVYAKNVSRTVKRTQRSSVIHLASNLVSCTQKPTELVKRIMHISDIDRKSPYFKRIH
jgi:hypothetical protein